MTVLLAIARDHTVRQVPLTAEALKQLRVMYEGLADEYLQGRDPVPYEPGYSPTEDEYLILDFELAPPLSTLQQVLPSSVQRLEVSSLDGTPPAALVFVQLGDSPRLLFQAVSKGNVLRPRRAILFGQGRFELNSASALVPPSRLDAIYQGGQLIFRSEHQVRRFLDFREYFTEATDPEIENFFANSVFLVEDIGLIKVAATTLMRRKIARLAAEGSSIDTSKVLRAARRAKIPLTIKKGALVVPPERAGLRQMVDLLSDTYLESLVEPDRLFYASSKRRLG